MRLRVKPTYLDEPSPRARGGIGREAGCRPAVSAKRAQLCEGTWDMTDGEGSKHTVAYRGVVRRRFDSAAKFATRSILLCRKTHSR